MVSYLQVTFPTFNGYFVKLYFLHQKCHFYHLWWFQNAGKEVLRIQDSVHYVNSKYQHAVQAESWRYTEEKMLSLLNSTQSTYLSSIYFVPHIVLCAEDTVLNKMNQKPLLLLFTKVGFHCYILPGSIIFLKGSRIIVFHKSNTANTVYWLHYLHSLP